MRSRHEQKIKDGARPLLQEGEEVLSAFVARPRGWTQSGAGSAVIGDAQQERAHAAAGQAGFRLASPMALALTQRRLLSLSISSPIGLGVGGEVRAIVGSAPLADVDAIDVKRLLLGKTVTVTIRGVPFTLEANALADAGGLAEAFRRAKADAGNP